MYHTHTHSPQPHLTRTPHQHCRHPRTLTAHTHARQTTVHASQSPQQPHAQHRVLRQPHKQTKDYHRTTNTTQTHRSSSKSERNLIILQVNINGLRNKLEELKLLIHDTHADIITIQETKLTPKAKTPKIHSFTSVRTDRLHKAGGGLITLIRDNIAFTTTNIRSTINTHNIELQMVKVHINNTKHITIANIYIPPRDTTSTHYKTADTDIQHCIQYITNIPHSVLTGDVNAHSTLWHSYTDDHRGQLIADVISNSDHITLNTNTPTRVPNTTLQQTSSPDITTVIQKHKQNIWKEHLDAHWGKGRKAYTTYRNHTSKQRQFKTGVPQGGVLSPTLFNIYTSDLPPPSAPMQMTSQSHPHTQVRVQPRNTYNHTYTKFLSGQNKTTSY